MINEIFCRTEAFIHEVALILMYAFSLLIKERPKLVIYHMLVFLSKRREQSVTYLKHVTECRAT